MGTPNTGGSLPTSARLRLDALRAGSRPRTSYLSAAAATALRSVGLTAVGDVMGCATSQVAWALVPSCTTRSGVLQDRVRTGGAVPGGGTGYLGLVRRLYATALRRLADEAEALAADGVVGIALSVTERDGVTEVVALGTGVRAGARPALDRPFTTDLAGPDVAKLLCGGWAPVTLHVAVQLGVRHNDLTSARLMHAASSRWLNNPAWAGTNVEVDSASQLVQHTRAATRAVLAEQVTAAGADGCLLTSLDVTVEEKECAGMIGGGGDLVGLGVAIGTSVARVSRAAVTPSAPTLTFLPLTTRGDAR